MRGVIMSIEGNKAVLLTQGGDFKQIKNKNYTIGDKVKITTNYVARIGSIAAAVAVFGIGASASYLMPASYVSLDINPSFMMTLNVYDKVISIEPLNSEAEYLLANTDVRGMDINDTVEAIIKESQKEGYITDNGADVLVSVVPGIKTPKIEDKDKTDKVNYVIDMSDKAAFKEAKDMGVSIAKARAIEEYTGEFGGSVSENANKLNGMTVKKIQDEIASKKQPKPSDAPAQASAQSANNDMTLQGTQQPVPKPTPNTSAQRQRTYVSPQTLPAVATIGKDSVSDKRAEDLKQEIKPENPQSHTSNAETVPLPIREEPKINEAPKASPQPRNDISENKPEMPDDKKADALQNEPKKPVNEAIEPQNSDKAKNNTPTNTEIQNTQNKTQRSSGSDKAAVKNETPKETEPKDVEPKTVEPKDIEPKEAEQKNNAAEEKDNKENAPAENQPAPAGGTAPKNSEPAPPKESASGDNAPSGDGGAPVNSAPAPSKEGTPSGNNAPADNGGSAPSNNGSPSDSGSAPAPASSAPSNNGGAPSGGGGSAPSDGGSHGSPADGGDPR